MASPDPDEAVVEGARAALRRLGDAAPSRDAARAALEEIEAAWRRTPFTIGVVGDDVFARTDLLNALCGGGMLELEGRVPGCAAMRVRRGTSTRFRASRRDGTLEEATLPAELAWPTREQYSPADAARARVERHEHELLQAEREVPRLAREAPPWWAFWLWMVRWLVVRRARGGLAALERAREQLAGARREQAIAEEAEAAEARGLPEARAQFFERLRMLCSGMIAGRDVQEIELEVAEGPLAYDVEVIELTGVATRTEVDITVRVGTSQVEVAGGESSMRRALGPPVEAALGLARLPIEARARWVARRARTVLIAEIARLEDAVQGAELALRDRLARIEDLRVPDAARFVAAQLAHIGAQAAASIHAVLEHAGVHLASELARRASRWEAQLEAASSPEELKALAAQIDEEGVAEDRRIAEETRLLVMGGVGGCAHDLLPELFAGLRRPGMPDEHAVPPRGVSRLPPVAMLPSLTAGSASTFAAELGGAGQWIAGLFRSLDARRAELRDKVRERAERVRAAAEADLLDAEPALRSALLEVLGRELSAAVERRGAWLAAELAREQLAVDAERAALRPLVEVLDDARREARDLQERLFGREEPPRTAIAPGVA